MNPLNLRSTGLHILNFDHTQFMHLILQVKLFPRWMNSSCSQATTSTQRHIFHTGNQSLLDFSKMRSVVMEWVSLLSSQNLSLTSHYILQNFILHKFIIFSNILWRSHTSCDASLLLPCWFAIQRNCRHSSIRDSSISNCKQCEAKPG